MKNVPECICGYQNIGAWSGLSNTEQTALYYEARMAAMQQISLHDREVIKDLQSQLAEKKIRNFGGTGALELLQKLGIFLAENWKYMEGAKNGSGNKDEA